MKFKESSILLIKYSFLSVFQVICIFFFISCNSKQCNKSIKKDGIINVFGHDSKHQFKMEKTHNLYSDALKQNEKGEYLKAIEILNTVEKLEADVPKLYLDRGLAYRKLNNFKKALEDYTIAIELDSTFFEAFVNRGMLYYRISDNRKALDDFDKAIEINPDEPATYLNRGLVKYENKQQNEACEDWAKAKKIGYNEKYDDQIDILICKYCN